MRVASSTFLLAFLGICHIFPTEANQFITLTSMDKAKEGELLNGQIIISVNRKTEMECLFKCSARKECIGIVYDHVWCHLVRETAGQQSNTYTSDARRAIWRKLPENVSEATTFAMPETNCNSPFEVYGSSCLHSPQYMTTWGHAKLVCIDLAGHLVILDSAEKQQDVQDYVNDYFDQHYEEYHYNLELDIFWIGGYHMYNTDEHYWLDGSRVGTTYNNWEPGEPEHGTDYYMQIVCDPICHWFDNHDFVEFFLCQEGLI